MKDIFSTLSAISSSPYLRNQSPSNLLRRRVTNQLDAAKHLSFMSPNKLRPITTLSPVLHYESCQHRRSEVVQPSRNDSCQQNNLDQSKPIESCQLRMTTPKTMNSNSPSHSATLTRSSCHAYFSPYSAYDESPPFDSTLNVKSVSMVGDFFDASHSFKYDVSAVNSLKPPNNDDDAHLHSNSNIVSDKICSVNSTTANNNNNCPRNIISDTTNTNEIRQGMSNSITNCCDAVDGCAIINNDLNSNSNNFNSNNNVDNISNSVDTSNTSVNDNTSEDQVTMHRSSISSLPNPIQLQRHHQQMLQHLSQQNIPHQNLLPHQHLSQQHIPHQHRNSLHYSISHKNFTSKFNDNINNNNNNNINNNNNMTSDFNMRPMSYASS